MTFNILASHTERWVTMVLVCTTGFSTPVIGELHSDSLHKPLPGLPGKSEDKSGFHTRLLNGSCAASYPVLWMQPQSGASQRNLRHLPR